MLVCRLKDSSTRMFIFQRKKSLDRGERIIQVGWDVVFFKDLMNECFSGFLHTYTSVLNYCYMEIVNCDLSFVEFVRKMAILEILRCLRISSNNLSLDRFLDTMFLLLILFYLFILLCFVPLF